MHIRLLILPLLLSLSTPAFCQKHKEKQPVETDLTRALFQINDIHTRGIIVRLRTDQDRIKALRSQQYRSAADELEHRLRINNMELCYAFITRWTFGPIYFMESQHTAQLQRDSLIALTWDLQRDTMIAINHDSLYIVDYGTVMETIPGDDRTSDQGNTPLAGSYLVAKGSDQQQLAPPLPFYAKVWGDRTAATDLLVPVEIPADLADSIQQCLTRYKETDEMIHKEYKNALARYLIGIYDHINLGTPSARQESKAYSTTLTDAASRFNEHFIQYYCKRMDKDQSLIYSESPIYWWLRNPNIRYLPYLRDLELRLKESLDTREKFTAPH